MQENALKTPTKRYIQKLADASERLTTQAVIFQRKNEQLRSILNKRRLVKKGKRLALSGHFLISTPELQKAVAVAEIETAENQASKRQKTARKEVTINSLVSDDESNPGDELEEVSSDELAF